MMEAIEPRKLFAATIAPADVVPDAGVDPSTPLVDVPAADDDAAANSAGDAARVDVAPSDPAADESATPPDSTTDATPAEATGNADGVIEFMPTFLPFVPVNLSAEGSADDQTDAPADDVTSDAADDVGDVATDGSADGADGSTDQADPTATDNVPVIAYEENAPGETPIETMVPLEATPQIETTATIETMIPLEKTPTIATPSDVTAAHAPKPASPAATVIDGVAVVPLATPVRSPAAIAAIVPAASPRPMTSSIDDIVSLTPGIEHKDDVLFEGALVA